ncbi:MAG: S-adenosylmethionine synthetase N-terminal domain-containing protein, partial [Paracoccus sp. (in: a-proteobacteria)]|nr:S-adenosylmethionine synthetase N-terminal domain-containing protein [Paracoccus sp. (in: a-proteobacteria)]
MARRNYIFTSESVSEGHPDKVCDQISDAVLDAFLAEDPAARVACETFATTNLVVVGGEAGLADPERLTAMKGAIPQIVRETIRDIGYEQEKFHWEHCIVQDVLHEQSNHIWGGVQEHGAGDQGIMF